MKLQHRTIVFALSVALLFVSTGGLNARNHDSGSRQHNSGSSHHVSSGDSSNRKFGINPKFKIDRFHVSTRMKMDSLD
jgi:hypothetical protein